MPRDTPSTTSVIVYGELSLFEIPLLIKGQYQISNGSKTVRFTVQVGDKTLGEVIRYILGMVNGPKLQLDPPWDAIERIQLSSFVFLVETTNGLSRYGISYGDLGLDLGFLQLDKVEVHYTPGTAKAPNSSLDVNVFGSFLGVSFHDEPVGWDALKEQPPQTPSENGKTFRLDYLGLGQNVTLRNIDELTTVAKVIDALRDSYNNIEGNAVDPLNSLPALTYDDKSDWLIGAAFSVMESFDFSGVWNLPSLAGARISLKGERAKSLAGFEFEILYRRIADDLGQYHVELVLPDVLRRFQAGIASVTLPIIAVDIYTDGGFLIDLGFPRDLDFTRSFSIELIIMGIPVTGAIGIYFGVLGPQAVPNLPAIVGGEFRPVIVAGVGFRIGLGKSLKMGILEAGFFVGIEGLLEGTIGFYEPYEAGDARATFFRVQGRLQLTVNVYGKINFAIISAELDIYVYVAVEATFEAYRSALVAFEAGVKVSLTVKINLGLFKIPIKLSFSATIREEIVIGQDSVTPWQLDENAPPQMLLDRIGPVGYRRLPTGDIIADDGFAALLSPSFRADRQMLDALIDLPDEAEKMEVFFRPVISVGTIGDRPGTPPGSKNTAAGEVNLVATLMIRLARTTDEPLAPAEVFVWQVLNWGLDQIIALRRLVGMTETSDTITLSHLKYIADHLEGGPNPIKVTPEDVRTFFSTRVNPVLRPADWAEAPPALTPFPMIPVTTLTTGSANSTGYSANFETEPMCSVAYQKKVHEYFEALNPMRGDPAAGGRGMRSPNLVDQQLSMTELIFIDSFKLVLRDVVARSIEVFETHTEEAGSRTLRDIAADCGLDTPGGMSRILAANGDSKEILPPLSQVNLACDGMMLTEARALRKLAKRWSLTPLDCARAIRTQPVLRNGGTVTITGGRHLLTSDDTLDGLEETYGITRGELFDANPFFDWSVPIEYDYAPWPPEYPRLKVPAGSWINLPPLSLEMTGSETLDNLCNLYGGVPLWKIVEANPALPLGDQGLVWQGIPIFVQQGETIAAVAARVYPSGEPSFVAQVLLDDPSVLPHDARLAVTGGSYIIARGDTFASICARFQITEKALRDANPDEPWKFLHRPGVDEVLPEGVTLILPDVAAFWPGGIDPGTVNADGSADSSATLRDVARLFQVDPIALTLQNAGTQVLRTLARIVLPPVPATVAEAGQSPAELGLPFAQPPEAILRANQGAAAGQGADQQLGVVRIPDCEILPKDRLKEVLARDAGDGSTTLGAIASGMARFLMAGLRLPDPAADQDGDSRDKTTMAAEKLYPLYTLTGQQWPAPTAPAVEDWVQLAVNENPGARRLFGLRHADKTAVEPVKVHLTEVDLQVIAAYAAEAAAPEGLQPPIAALTPYPALEQLRLEQSLGAAAGWSLPSPISFTSPNEGDEGDADQVALMHELPRGMRELLPFADEALTALEVCEVTADPVARVGTRRQLTDVGWATRLELQLRKAQPDGPLAQTTYEVVSLLSQAQADLEGLRLFVNGTGAALNLELYLLYDAGPLSSVSDTLRSDSLDPAALGRVALLKSNLSTFSNPAGRWLRSRAVERIGVEKLASAPLTQGREFLDLLWQVSVTNGAGFFLDYPIGAEAPGLPDELFGAAGIGGVSILAIVRDASATGPTIPPARFHNVLVTAQNLSDTKAQLSVTARDHLVTADEGISQSLGAIAAAFGIGADTLALLNAATPALLMPGQAIAYGAEQTYTVQLGDDLMTVALQTGQTVEGLGLSIKDQTGLLMFGAPMFVRPRWVKSVNRVNAALAGFRMLRPQPVEPLPPEPPIQRSAEPNPAHGRNAGLERSQLDTLIEPAEARYRLQMLFQLLGYGLTATDGFDVSPQGLPLLPNDTQDPRDPLSRIALTNENDPGPWNYRRLLPLAPYARELELDPLLVPDPYAGLAATARIELAFQDVFGNRLPRTAEPLAQDWQQLFRDPVVPLHAWPSVTLSYDPATKPTWQAPRLQVSVKFAPAGYTPTIGRLQHGFRDGSLADQEKLALAYYQVVGQRMAARIETSLLPGEIKKVSTDRLAKFARDAWFFIETMRSLEPVTALLDEATTPAVLGRDYGLSGLDMARHLGVQPGLLSTENPVFVPQIITVLPNQSLATLSQDNTQGRLSPGDIGVLNRHAPITPGLQLRRGGKLVEVKRGMTLAKLATEAVTIRELSKENADVTGLFVNASTLSLGHTERLATQDETLAQLALVERVDFELLAMANLDEPIFRPGTAAEIPLHMRLTTSPEDSARIPEGTDLVTFADTHYGSVRDISTANGALADLLIVGAKLRYRPDGATPEHEHVEIVGENDTLAAMATRFAAHFGDPSIRPADIGRYPANAENTKLFRPDALLILPPLRFTIDLDVPEIATRSVTVADLRCWLTLWRDRTELIDPAFRRAADVIEARSDVAPRLTSGFSREERGTLKAFARQFQSVFPNLRLGVGADIITSVNSTMLAREKEEVPTKLVVVQWDPLNFWAQVEGKPRFYAPRPLLNKPWDGKEVPIYPYTPGQPIYPSEGNEPTPVLTGFSGVDLERWAERALERIDRILQPDMAVPIRRADAALYQKIVNAKSEIASAVAARVTNILADQTDGDPKAAGEQLKQQLLTELASGYRGGIVVQFDVDARALDPQPAFDHAPRLLVAMTPVLELVPDDNPTLDRIGDIFDTDAGLAGYLIKNVQDLLITGAKLPLKPPPGVDGPEILETDTLARIAERFDISLPDLVAKIHATEGLFKAGAQLPISRRKATSDLDDSLGSLIEKLAPNLTTPELVERAIRIFASLNAHRKDVLIEGAEVTWKDKTYTVKAGESLNALANRIGAGGETHKLIDALWETAPLLRPGITFVYLAQYPPVTAAATKIVIGTPDTGINTMNTVVVTQAPDDASNISLKFGFDVQAMEYNIHAVPGGAGYLGSNWLGFIDWSHGQDLGEIVMPVPNRQFPLAPVVLRHEAEPAVRDGSVDPDQIGKVMNYDYVLDFSFFAATQDHIYYTADFNVTALFLPAATDEQLAHNLAQFDAVDADLWADVLGFLSEEADPQVTRVAVSNFAEIVTRVAQSWSTWQAPLTAPAKEAPVAAAQADCFRIRHHRHPVTGRSNVTMAPVPHRADAPMRLRGPGSMPRARQLGVASIQGQSGLLSFSITAADTRADGVPVPSTRRGTTYEVRDPGQSILRQQNCWGRIGVSRNETLVDRATTATDFVLQLPDVKALQPLTPDFRITQELRVGTRIAPFEERLAELLENLFFPAPDLGPVRISVTAAFARPLVESAEPRSAEPADSRTFFAPVITTPLITVTPTASGTEPRPADVAKVVSDRLRQFLAVNELAPTRDWSLTIKLFSSLGDASTAPVLLELVDVRLRMSDQ